MTEKEDGALKTINKALRIKDQIDKPFDVFELINNEVNVLDKSENPQEEIIHKLDYKVKNDYFGFNVISHLNLGRAYKLENNEDGDKHEYNISPNAKRVKFPESEQNVFNEKWVDHVFNTVKGSRYSAVVLENVFTRVTTGNWQEILPYKEQLRALYKKIKEHGLEDKIIALVRGAREMEILKNGGPDLMAILGDSLKIKDRVTGPKTLISMHLSDSYKKDAEVTLMNFNPNGNIGAGIFKKMIEFIENQPGFDVYWNSTARCSGMEDAFMTHDRNDPKKSKPCTALFFGPMCEYDLINTRRGLPPYTLNHIYFKLSYEHSIVKIRHEDMTVKEEMISKVKAHFNDYNAPHEDKKDSSNYVAAIISDSEGEVLQGFADIANDLFTDTIENIVNKSRKNTNLYLKKQEKHKKEDEQILRKSVITKINPTNDHEV